ncbi:MAG: ATP-binding protein [Candidatus Margulisiibacteriota bacterium]|nr:ATP-binding protein [Candidatus Margulisiibacteriota bacterium]
MSFYSWSLLFTSIASLSLGIFVVFKGRKLQNTTLGWLSFAMALWCFGQFMGEIAGNKELVLFWTRAGVGAAVFIPIFFLHFILSLVGKAFAEKRTIGLVYGLGIMFLGLDFTAFFVADIEPALGFRYYPKPGVVYPFFAIFIFSCFGYGLLRLFLAYRDAYGARRNQLLYVLVAAIIGFSGGVTTFFPIWGINFPILSHYSLPLYLLITVYAIVKHRLLDISVIIRESLIYSTLTLLFAGFYALAVLATNYLLLRFVDFPPVLTVILVVFASVLVFQPVREKVQRGVDRLFFRGEFGYQKTIDDLSAENKKLFQSLLRSDKLAALGTLSAGMAHEIKNPLASIKGMTQVLDENLNDPEFIKKYQELVSRQIDRINNLVEKLLKFGQPQTLALKEFDLCQVIEDVLSLLENQCKKKQVEVVKELKHRPKIEGDAEQLSQVFMNFLLNAIQAMGDRGELSVKSAPRGPNFLCIEVRDTGAGIPTGKIDNIFDPFFTTRDKGTGMGLAVAYRIVKEHGGEINVESEIGRGTEFRIWLPIKQKR